MNNLKTILISGGTKGIGKSFVLKLLQDGFNVATFSRDVAKVKILNEELSSLYDIDRFIVLRGDVTNENEVKKVVGDVIAKFKTINILINNAGIGYFRDADKFDINRFNTMINTNIVGVALLTKYVVPQMKLNKTGLIINIASISGKVAFANGEFYSATKFAVMGYSQAIRAELKEFGIKVSTICPGMIKTEFFDDEELERRKKVWNGVVPQMLEVDDVANIVSLVCKQSDHCDVQDVTLMPF